MAYEESLKSPMSKKHGAVIVKNGKMIAAGCNKYNNRSMQKCSWRNSDETRLRKLYEERCPEVPFYKFADKAWGKSSCSIHAEIDAIVKAGQHRARDSTMYVVRYGGEGRDIPMWSQPCVKCAKACNRLNIKVFYTVPT